MFENGPRETGTQNGEDLPFVVIQAMAFMLPVFITYMSFIPMRIVFFIDDSVLCLLPVSTVYVQHSYGIIMERLK
jgi:hypothetical protein